MKKFQLCLGKMEKRFNLRDAKNPPFKHFFCLRRIYFQNFHRIGAWTFSEVSALCLTDGKVIIV